MPNFITNLKNAFNVDTAPIEILTGFQAIFATFGSYFVAGTYTAFGSLSILMILSGITQIISVGWGNLYARHYSNVIQSCATLAFTIILFFNLPASALGFGGYFGLFLMTSWCFIYTSSKIKEVS